MLQFQSIKVYKPYAVDYNLCWPDLQKPARWKCASYFKCNKTDDERLVAYVLPFINQKTATANNKIRNVKIKEIKI